MEIDIPVVIRIITMEVCIYEQNCVELEYIVYFSECKIYKLNIVCLCTT